MLGACVLIVHHTLKLVLARAGRTERTLFRGDAERAIRLPPTMHTVEDILNVLEEC